MAIDSFNDPRSQGRDQQISYGSFGPWAGAVMQGLGMMPTGGLGLAGLGLGLGSQALTGKSILGNALGAMGLGGLLGHGVNPTAQTGLMPDQFMGGLLGGSAAGGGWSGGGWGGPAGGMGMDARGANG